MYDAIAYQLLVLYLVDFAALAFILGSGACDACAALVEALSIF